MFTKEEIKILLQGLGSLRHVEQESITFCTDKADIKEYNTKIEEINTLILKLSDLSE